MPDLAPIVLFVYDRPWHTQQCLESLLKNELADQSTLYIYSDGPKVNASEEQVQRIKEVRQIIRQGKWCGKVEMIEQQENQGLAKSIIGAVTEIVNQYGKIIVLEDDLLLSHGFLKYINEALDIYRNDEKVMHVSGYMYPVESENLPETFFLTLASCWGWGTWKRAWSQFNSSASDLLKQIKPGEIKKFDLGFPHYALLKDCVDKPGSSWAIRWHASVFVNKGLCLHPADSLVKNIGHDGSGIHCDDLEIFSHQVIAGYADIKKEKIQVHARAEMKAFRFQKKMYGDTPVKMLKKIALTFPSLIRKSYKYFTYRPNKKTMNGFEDWSNHVELLNLWGKETVWNEIKDFLQNANGKILDIGCGTCATVQFLSGIKNVELHGCDISEKLLSECKEKGIPSARLKYGDLKSKIDYSNNEFDYTYSIGVLHYFNESELLNAIKEISRITRKTSFLFVPVSASQRDEGWISNWHKFQNNSVAWWARIFSTEFSKVIVKDSIWKDEKISDGKWFLCYKEL
jgi:ubiquinone/menaquinone biosynthesis C-methylase UbiE